MSVDEIVHTAVQSIETYDEHRGVHHFYGELEDGTGCVNVFFDLPRSYFYIQVTDYGTDTDAKVAFPYLTAEALLPAFKAVVEVKKALLAW